MSEETFLLRYEFRLADGVSKSFEVTLGRMSMDLIPATDPRPVQPQPDWTALKHHQCPNCPLASGTSPQCPIAVNLVDVIDSFRDCLSIEHAEIIISTHSREYRKRAPLQYGISSLMGIYMVTAGCPIMDKLRPMVLTHLPFANIEETLYRAVSMYLFAQYYRNLRGKNPDWKLEKLVRIYEGVSVVNKAFARRLLSINPQDASLNALVGLDCFAAVTAFSITRDSLKELELLFHAYLNEP